MPLALYMDVHVSAAITAGLRRRGIDVLTSQEDGTRTADDEVLLARSTALGRVMVSHDEDLLQIARDWQIAGTPFTGLAFAPQRGSSVGTLIDDLGLMSECMSADEIANNVVFMPLK